MTGMRKNQKGLVAPSAYFDMTEERKAEICNGAGPKQFGWLVPDTLYGLSITEAANIHDFMYAGSYTKRAADIIFYENMKTIINTRGGIFRRPRLARAWLYFQAVDKLGGLFK